MRNWKLLYFLKCCLLLLSNGQYCYLKLWLCGYYTVVIYRVFNGFMVSSAVPMFSKTAGLWKISHIPKQKQNWVSTTAQCCRKPLGPHLNMTVPAPKSWQSEIHKAGVTIWKFLMRTVAKNVEKKYCIRYLTQFLWQDLH